MKLLEYDYAKLWVITNFRDNTLGGSESLSNHRLQRILIC